MTSIDFYLTFFLPPVLLREKNMGSTNITSEFLLHLQGTFQISGNLKAVTGER